MVVRARNRRWQELEKDGIPLERLVRHFEAYNRSEGKSPATVYWYSRVLTYFGDYLKEHNLSDTLGDLDTFTVREFILYLQTKKKWNRHPYVSMPRGNLAAVSVQTYVRALRAFFSWLHREGYTGEHILADLKPPRAPQKLVEVLTDDEVRQILACLDSDTPSGSRNKAILITLLDTGLRLSELTNLKMADGHVEQGYLRVMGKGSKERIVPIGGIAQKVLLRYVYHFRPEPLSIDEDTLFLMVKG